MKPVLVSRENNTAKFTMAFSAEEFDAALDKAYKAQRGKIEVPGFRKGKAPRSVIEKRYGMNSRRSTGFWARGVTVRSFPLSKLFFRAASLSAADL